MVCRWRKAKKRKEVDESGEWDVDCTDTPRGGGQSAVWTAKCETERCLRWYRSSVFPDHRHQLIRNVAVQFLAVTMLSLFPALCSARGCSIPISREDTCGGEERSSNGRDNNKSVELKGRPESASVVPPSWLPRSATGATRQSNGHVATPTRLAFTHPSPETNISASRPASLLSPLPSQRDHRTAADMQAKRAHPAEGPTARCT